MSLDLVTSRPTPRLAAEERELVRAVGSAVARASRILLRYGRTPLSKADLEAFGMLAVWRKLPTFDPARALFDRWAFYQALRGMLDVSRHQRKDDAFASLLRRVIHDYLSLDDRPAQRDFETDTPETDAARLHARNLALGAVAWIEVMVEHADRGAPAEATRTAAEAVHAVREELARLSDEQQALLRLRFWDDLEVKEAAGQLDMSERTLRRRWVETRDLLLKRLRARGIFGIPEGFAEALDALTAHEEPPR